MTDSPATKETSSSKKKESAPPPHLPPFDNDDDDDDDNGGDGGNDDSIHKAKRARKVKESVIDHTYRDYSLVEVTSTDDDNDDDEDQGPNQRKKDPKASLNFPAKLHAILSNPSYQHIICWMVSKIIIIVNRCRLQFFYICIRCFRPADHPTHT